MTGKSATQYARAMLQEGQRVLVPDPADERRVVTASFLAIGEPDEALEERASEVVGGTRRRDVGWVRYDDGSAHCWPLDRIQPA
jgi:hypothetical protein